MCRRIYIAHETNDVQCSAKARDGYLAQLYKDLQDTTVVANTADANTVVANTVVKTAEPTSIILMDPINNGILFHYGSQILEIRLGYSIIVTGVATYYIDNKPIKLKQYQYIDYPTFDKCIEGTFWNSSINTNELYKAAVTMAAVIDNRRANICSRELT